MKNQEVITNRMFGGAQVNRVRPTNPVSSKQWTILFVYLFGWRIQPGSQPDLKADSHECSPSPAEPAHQADHRASSKLKWSREKTPEGTLGRDSPSPIQEGLSPEERACLEKERARLT